MFQCGFISRYYNIFILPCLLKHFLGNEDDYIIISVVRSRSTGFLNNLRRTNVMLTRCKKGMFIFSSQKFLTGPGAETLVGTMLKKMGNSWISDSDLEEIDL